MTKFDDLDAQMNSAIDDEYASGVKWRPRRSKGPANVYTNGPDEPDPDRERPAGEALKAVVTWRPDVIGPGGLDNAAGTERSAIESFEVSVDFAADQFSAATGGSPQKGDYLFLEDEYEGNRLVEIARDGNDGSQRLLFWCVFPESGEVE